MTRQKMRKGRRRYLHNAIEYSTTMRQVSVQQDLEKAYLTRKTHALHPKMNRNLTWESLIVNIGMSPKTDASMSGPAHRSKKTVNDSRANGIVGQHSPQDYR